MQKEINQNIASKKEKASFTKGFIEQLELVAVFFAIVLVIFSFVCRSCVVKGDSMMNTLHNEERVIIWDLFYTPKRGDIVVIHESETLVEPIVKRVIAIPGDTVTVKHYTDGMKVTVTDKNGVKIDSFDDEEYIRYVGSLANGHDVDELKVPEGKIFVMGDNRLNSTDSRMLGCLDSRQVLGKVIFRMTPLNKIGIVK